MFVRTRSALRYKQAFVIWLVAYVAITILGSSVYVLIAATRHTGSTSQPLQDPAYLLDEKLLPALNLLVWALAALVYFRRARVGAKPPLGEALLLGALWLAIALPIDFVGFVVIHNPLSMSAHDFYLGQFPWIFLVYAAVFVSPLCVAALMRSRKPRTRHRAAVSLL